MCYINYKSTTILVYIAIFVQIIMLPTGFWRIVLCIVLPIILTQIIISNSTVTVTIRRRARPGAVCHWGQCQCEYTG